MTLRRKRFLAVAGFFILLLTAGGVLWQFSSHAASITIMPSELKLPLDNSAKVSAYLHGKLLSNVKWVSSNSSVAEVSKTGDVFGKKPGEATITAEARNYTGSIKVSIEGIKSLTFVLPKRIGYGQYVRPKIKEVLDDGQVYTYAKVPFYVSASQNLVSYHKDYVYGQRLGGGTVTVKAPFFNEITRVGVDVVPVVPTNQDSDSPNFVPHAPAIVQIDNGPTSDPHSGIQQADLVFEYLTEGGITRFTAVYYNLPNTLIGPVRSARPIVAPIQHMLDGMPFFSGASVGTYALLYRAHVPAITDDCCAQYFFRVDTHVSPSNLFTTGKLLQQALETVPSLVHQKLPYVLLPAHQDTLSNGPVKSVTIDMSSATIDQYVYNPASREFERYMNGAAELDTTTGKPIQIKNLIVLYTTATLTSYVEDVLGNHTYIYNLQGKGDFVAFIDGNQYKGMWYRPAENQPIIFTTASVMPLPLQTGLTWISVVDPSLSYLSIQY